MVKSNFNLLSMIDKSYKSNKNKRKRQEIDAMNEEINSDEFDSEDGHRVFRASDNEEELDKAQQSKMARLYYEQQGGATQTGDLSGAAKS